MYQIWFNNTTQRGMLSIEQYMVVADEDIDALNFFHHYLKKNNLTGLITAFEEVEGSIKMVNRLSSFSTLGELN